MIEHERLTLGGVDYAVVPMEVFRRLCAAAGEDDALLRAERLGDRIRQRRKGAGLTQVELARRCGLRPESLNRIERGRVDPSFGTVRKLVEALARVEEGVSHVD